MSAQTFTIEDAQAANLVLAGVEKGRQAVHDLVTAYRANRRTGSACTKTRGEVSGNNKKIFKQKGTGNARHGDKRAPIFVGGGVVFGPRPRDYSKKVPKTVRKLALRRVGDAGQAPGHMQWRKLRAVSPQQRGAGTVAAAAALPLPPRSPQHGLQLLVHGQEHR